MGETWLVGGIWGGHVDRQTDNKNSSLLSLASLSEYSGPPDSIHGSALFQKVRLSAQVRDLKPLSSLNIYSFFGCFFIVCKWGNDHIQLHSCLVTCFLHLIFTNKLNLCSTKNYQTKENLFSCPL